MFTTFRQRLLFWFVVLISFNLVLIAITNRYLSAREDVQQALEKIDSFYLLLLKDVKVQNDFLSFETTNVTFFTTSHSSFLALHKAYADSLFTKIDEMNQIRQFDIHKDLKSVYTLLTLEDTIFRNLVSVVQKRGYKDFSLEGEMRASAHKLERSPSLTLAEVLSLRRHEKDYIIRHEQRYVDQLNQEVASLQQKLNPIRHIARDSTLDFLTNYVEDFNTLVALERRAGLHDNSGLKKELNTTLSLLETVLDTIVSKANHNGEALLQRLNYIYAGLVTGLILISITVSYFIARLITKPLTELTLYISRFVESQFTLESNNPVIRSKDEIGKLTQNFTVLKEEIISQLKFFKQKVDERTEELAQANKKLIRINEANSRFVPIEFLQFLHRNSIEEVVLGDQVEQNMTVMFTDIRDFTSLSEKLRPQENFDFINSYLNVIVPVIENNQGFIDKFIGDSVMALFPTTIDHAVRAAIEISIRIEAFNESLKQAGLPPIKVGTGIHFGQLILGTIGHEHHLETTVISDAVNIASRLEGLTKHYGTSIIISGDSMRLLLSPGDFQFRFLETVKVMGKSKSIDVYEVLLPHEKSKKESIPTFNEAIRNFKDRDFKRAASLLSILAEKNEQDEVARVFLNRCRNFLQNGTPEGWDSVAVMKTK